MDMDQLMAQQQAIMNQALQNQQQFMWGVLLLQIAFLVVTSWVIYMFYARLRDISVEIRHFRLAFEAEHKRPDRGRTPGSSLPPSNPFEGESDDSRYRPKG